MKEILPNFVILGGIRCGSSWLSYNLKQHPQIYLPEKKETHFFDRTTSYEAGIDEYRAHYQAWQGQPAVGDSTPTYLGDSYTRNNVPEMIARHLTDARLIVSLRNPTERVISQYWHNRSKFPENKRYTFREKMEREPSFLREGMYAVHIRRYLQYFPLERFHFIFFDDIQDRPDQVLADVFRFLGVDENFHSPLAHTRINSAHSKKHEGRSMLLYYLFRGFFKLGWHKPAQALERANWVEKPPIDPATLHWLVEEVYQQPNRDLQDLLGRDLQTWNQPPGQKSMQND